MPEGLVHAVTVPASTGHHPCKTPPQLCLRDHLHLNAPCPMILLLSSCSCGWWSSTQHKTLDIFRRHNISRKFTSPYGCPSTRGAILGPTPAITRYGFYECIPKQATTRGKDGRSQLAKYEVLAHGSVGVLSRSAHLPARRPCPTRTRPTSRLQSCRKCWDCFGKLFTNVFASSHVRSSTP
ncbi:hypothetical protein BGW80DRAFT_143199 [Lactifluus volemus]|nr:hypothetical protein BGW80DRAFT_143199 [Lactifluus volemus]